MKHCTFSPGTYFNYSGTRYCVMSKQGYPADNRIIMVNVVNLDDMSMGYFFLRELNEWKRKGVIYNVWKKN